MKRQPNDEPRRSVQAEQTTAEQTTEQRIQDAEANVDALKARIDSNTVEATRMQQTAETLAERAVAGDKDAKAEWAELRRQITAAHDDSALTTVALRLGEGRLKELKLAFNEEQRVAQLAALRAEVQPIVARGKAGLTEHIDAIRTALATQKQLSDVLTALQRPELQQGIGNGWAELQQLHDDLITKLENEIGPLRGQLLNLPFLRRGIVNPQVKYQQ